ncbi:NAD(P)/FAD-dependent oxidoreductase [Nonomuraea sp. NPDC049714]|uniref:NAD(P)/FAD-dependent oxidoreductase n=1 Tax=Nonomuraea sp. NPDC049714 TaxID=3364357 RepID=UPI00379B647B
MQDVIIIGGGPAGLSAALMLGRAHREVLLVDSDEGRNAPAEAVHNFLTRDGTPPERVRALAREQLAAYPAVRFLDGVVTGVRRLPEGGFELGDDGGGVVATGRRLLLATGLADRLPAITGLEPLWGRSAFHCPYCHGYEVTGRRVAVIGAGPDRVRLALQLSRFTPDVVLCTGGLPLDGPGRDLLAAADVPVRCEPIARLEGEGGRLGHIVFEGARPLARDALFVRTTPRQRSDLAGKLGCRTFPDATVEIDEFGRTSEEGVYAAGDMARRATLPMPLAAVIAAAAGGTVAGGMIDQDLLSEDFALPRPFPAGAA